MYSLSTLRPSTRFPAFRPGHASPKSRIPVLRCLHKRDNGYKPKEITKPIKKSVERLKGLLERPINLDTKPYSGAPSILAGFSGASLLTLAALGFPALDIGSKPFFVAQALGVLALIVAVHEAGHFTAARVQGIHVSKFAIGFGPSLFSFERSGVEYSLRAIPFGGFVAFPDDDPESPYAPDDPNLLKNRSVASRAAVISAGVVANIIFAYLVLLLQVGTVGKAENVLLPGVQIPSIAPSSLAAQAGLRSGDVILGIDDQVLRADLDEVNRLVTIIRSHPNESVELTVQRNSPSLVAAAPPLAAAPPPIKLLVIPEEGPDGAGRIGVRLNSNVTFNHRKPKDASDLIRLTNREFVRLTSRVLDGLKMVLTNFLGVAGQLSGPVAIVAAGSEIAKTDESGLFQFCAVVNINLAVVNALPLPALDGGYMVLVLLESLRGGKKLPTRFEQSVMASGALLLFGMGISLLVKDTVNLLPL